VTPSKGFSLNVEGGEGGGLSGMVALTKMRESRRRGRLSMKLCGDLFSFGEGVELVERGGGNRNDVLRGVGPDRVARGEAGRPYGELGDVDIAIWTVRRILLLSSKL
jgi:hypothetical protein